MPATPKPSALVIGSGIAGCTSAHLLAASGYSVTVLEQGDSAASGASGNAAGALFPRFSASDSTIQTYYMSALRYARRYYAAAQQHYSQRFWFPCPVIRHAKNDREWQKMQHWLATRCYRHVLQAVPGEQAVIIRGAGMLAPNMFCRMLLHQKAITLQTSTAVLNVIRDDMRWKVVTPRGEYSADTVVVCTGWQAPALLPQMAATIRPSQGQLDGVYEQPAGSDASILCRSGYFLPALPDGLRLFGSTYQRGSISTQATDAATQKNLATLRGLHQQLADSFGQNAPRYRRASVRGETPGHFPIAHKIADGLYVNAGHGSRGLLTAPVSAHHLLRIIRKAHRAG